MAGRTRLMAVCGVLAVAVAGLVPFAVDRLGERVRPDRAGPAADAFTGDGVVRLPVGAGHARASSVAVDAGGRTVLAGQSSRSVGVARLTAEGAPDRSFGGTGTVVTAVGAAASAAALVVQPDGRPVVAGRTTPTEGSLDADVAVLRYTADGALDASFGDAGVVTTSLPGPVTVSALVLQPDGRLVVAGFVQTSADGVDTDVLLARYLPDGRLDAQFGDGGTVLTDVSRGGPDVAAALALDAEGRLVVAGASGQPDRSAPATSTWTLLRYLPHGQLDPAFGGGDGIALHDVSPRGETLSSVTTLADGRMVAAGSVDLDGTMPQVAVVRLRADGSSDPSFGDAGTVFTAAARLSEGDAVAVQEDGRVVVSGRAADDALDSDPDWEWLVLRYDLAGRLDPSYGAGGIVRRPYGEVADALALLPDGGAVVAGCDCPLPAYARGDQESPSSFVVGRLDVAGSPRG